MYEECYAKHNGPDLVRRYTADIIEYGHIEYGSWASDSIDEDPADYNNMIEFCYTCNPELIDIPLTSQGE